MSWSVNVVGDAETIGNEFDAVQVRAAANGMIKDEQRDIHNASVMAVTLAEAYGKVWVQANGHWSVPPAPDEPSFGQISITISKAPAQ
jgi:hypothetical protein